MKPNAPSQMLCLAEEEIDHGWYARYWYLFNRAKAGSGDLTNQTRAHAQKALLPRLRHKLTNLRLKNGWGHDVDSVNRVAKQGVEYCKRLSMERKASKEVTAPQSSHA